MPDGCRLGIYEKAMPAFISWEDRFRAAKESGYDFVELSIDESPERLARLEMTGREKLAILEKMEQTGMFLESMCLSGHRKYPLGSSDRRVRELSLEIMEKAILLARDLGVRTIQLAGYDVYYEVSTPETKAYFESGLKRCVELAEQYHVMLAFETMETPFLNTVKKCMRYIEEQNSPWLQIYPDSGNIVNAAAGEKEAVLKDLEAGAGHLAAMHLKETAPGKFREIPYGTGHVPFQEIIKKAQGLGVRRFVAEFWYNGGLDWKKQLTDNRDFLIRKF